MNFAITATCVLALLHFGRPVLQPIVLALMLSLAVAPLIRAMAIAGLSRVHATLATLVLVCAALVAGCMLLGAQLLTLSDDLPQYRGEIVAKLKDVQRLAEQQPLARFPVDLLGDEPFARPGGARAAPGSDADADGLRPIPVEIHEHTSAKETLTKLVGAIFGPLGEAGLVFVLLVFILLDSENLRERILRLTGQRAVSRTIKGLEDAARGVSRFFFSQFLVNLVFGAVLATLLWLLGLPHAALLAALCALLRFVPYIGALIAASGIAVFAAASSPGWALAVYAVLLFGTLELVLANIVEPRVYGHSSGMSPLAVIVSALFWSALWGPVGLLLSTPLTLCIVVAGRYIRALEPVSILLAEAPNASEGQRFYHRLLSGEAAAILQDARVFLRKFTLARYCDQVLLPGVELAVADLRGDGDEPGQQQRLRATIALVMQSLGQRAAPVRSHRGRVSMLNESIGAHLRHAREERLGRWQGSLEVPERSIVLCVSLPTVREEFLSEMLVISLREAGIDARSLVLGALDEASRPDAEHLVSTVFVVYPVESAPEAWIEAVTALRESLPEAPLVTIAPRAPAAPVPVGQRVDLVLRSFEEALAFVTPAKATAGAA